MKQICIYPKDVAIILGKSQTHAQSLLRTMKDIYNKKKHQAITIREFCDYMALPFDGVLLLIVQLIFYQLYYVFVR